MNLKINNSTILINGADGFIGSHLTEASVTQGDKVQAFLMYNLLVERMRADNAKAKQLFDWQPSYAGRLDFKSGLAEMVEWFSEYDNLRSYKADIYNI